MTLNCYDSIWSFCDNIQHISAQENLQTLLGQQIDYLGFEQFGILSFRPGVPVTWFCSDKLSLEAYIEQNAFRFDPIIHRAENSLIPFSWNTRQWNKISDKQAQCALSIWQNLGINNGISIPIHGPGIHFSVFSVYNQNLMHQDVTLQREIEAVLQLLGLYVITVFQHQLTVDNTPELTPREIDCLRWTARGKTAWEIGKILDISERTVRFHLNNVMQKLDVTSKYQAVLKAVEVGALRY